MKAFRHHILSHLTRRRVMAAAIDLVIVVLSYYLILAFRFQGSIPDDMDWGSYNLTVFLIAAVVFHLGFNALFHVYAIVNRYVGLPQATWIVWATGASITVLLVVDLVWPTEMGRLVPLSVVVVGGAAAGAAMTAVRFYSRLFQTRSLRQVQGGRRVMLVGAGSAAEMLIRQIDHTPALGISIVGLLDDDPRLLGMRIAPPFRPGDHRRGAPVGVGPRCGGVLHHHPLRRRRADGAYLHTAQAGGPSCEDAASGVRAYRW